MGIEKVGIVWHEYCSNNKFLKILLPISIPLLLITAVIRLIENFVSFGSAAAVVIYVLFILGILLVFANSAYQILAMGFGIAAVDSVCSILRNLFKSHPTFNWSAFLYVFIWGFFAYLAYKKSFKINS